MLTDNEKTVTVEHVAGIPVRNRQMVAFAGHYAVGENVRAGGPGQKGGSEDAVKMAKADLVPTDGEPAWGSTRSFADVGGGLRVVLRRGEPRVHRVTRRAPVDMLAEERPRLHRLPGVAFTAGFGMTRQVPANTPMVTFEAGQYSVPRHCSGQTVWVRVHGAGPGEQVVIVHLGTTARSRWPGTSRDTGHPRSRRRAFHPPAPEGALDAPRGPARVAEAAFLAMGEGARLWLVEAAERRHCPDAGEDGQSGGNWRAVRRRRGRCRARPRRGPRPVR